MLSWSSQNIFDESISLRLVGQQGAGDIGRCGEMCGRYRGDDESISLRLVGQQGAG